MPLEIIKGSIPGNTLCQEICITYSFIVDNPNYLRNFLLFAGQDQLGENYLTYSQIWGAKNTLGKKYALHIRDIQAPPNKSCMRQFSARMVIFWQAIPTKDFPEMPAVTLLELRLWRSSLQSFAREKNSPDILSQKMHYGTLP